MGLVLGRFGIGRRKRTRKQSGVDDFARQISVAVSFEGRVNPSYQFSHVVAMLLDEDDALVLNVELFVLREPEEVIVERQQGPPVFSGVLEVVTVAPAERLLVSSSRHLPPSASEAVNNGLPDVFVGVDHAGVSWSPLLGGAESNSSGWP